jgi:hypothetical protein
MTTTAVDELLAYYRDVVAQMNSQIADMEIGRLNIRENNGRGWVDITTRFAEEQRQRVNRLEQIVAAHEKRDRAA